MSYAGLGLGGTFAPDCYLQATGKADVIGPPITAASLASYQKTYGADSANKIAAVCNQTASPLDCMGQFFLRDAFLGRPCKGDWVTHVNQRLQAPLPAPMAALPAPPTADNTMLYVGGALVAAVAIGGVYLATSGKKGRR